VSHIARIKLKTKRARDHLHDLERSIQEFRASAPYGFRIEDDSKTGDKIHRLDIRKATPDSFALSIGDVVHNLRAALDHLAWQLVIENSNTPTSGANGTQFPIYLPSPKPKPNQGKIAGISPTAQTLIDAIKPYKGGNDDFWMLHQLDITDKHKILLVTAFALSEMMPTWKGINGWHSLQAAITSLTPKNGVVDFNLDVLDPYTQCFNICVPIGKQLDGTLPVITNGTIVAKLIAPIQEEARFDLSFEIIINEPDIIAGKPIIPLLSDLATVIEDFIDQFGVAGCLT